MEVNKETQGLQGEAVRARIAGLGLTQTRLARELRRSPTGIVRALNGERKTLLGRINRWLDRYERTRAKRAA